MKQGFLLLDISTVDIQWIKERLYENLRDGAVIAFEYPPGSNNVVSRIISLRHTDKIAPLIQAGVVKLIIHGILSESANVDKLKKWIANNPEVVTFLGKTYRDIWQDFQPLAKRLIRRTWLDGEETVYGTIKDWEDAGSPDTIVTKFIRPHRWLGV